MKKGILFTIVATVIILNLAAVANAQLAPNAPPDKPVNVAKDQARRLEAAINPYIEQARKTYPEAKARYLAGLPKGEAFFVTAKLSDSQGHFEIVFIRVAKIIDGKITGQIANDITLVTSYKRGNEYTLSEADLLDWTISKADGSEEGNVVGKFLDTYKP
jgi:uncharacterized protein YegJ (DUF2314 family)